MLSPPSGWRPDPLQHPGEGDAPQHKQQSPNPAGGGGISKPSQAKPKEKEIHGKRSQAPGGQEDKDGQGGQYGR